jgi:hypothetical protein
MHDINKKLIKETNSEKETNTNLGNDKLDNIYKNTVDIIVLLV